MKCYSFTALLLVFCFVSAFSGVSNVYSEEMATISKAELTTLLDEREFLIKELKDFKESYSLLDQKYLDLENESHRQKIESDLRIASLADLKKTMVWNNVKWFLAGMGVGFAGGEAVGIQIGVSL